MAETVRSKLLSRHATIGSWLEIPHASAAEIMARAGFDWLVIDAEHGGIDIETGTDLMRAIRAANPDCEAFVRVTDNHPLAIRRALDAGATGVVVPLINSGAEAEKAVTAAKYPPRGVRGYGFSPANAYGAEFADYTARANEDISVVVQVEHVDALAHIDEILAVDGVDAAFLGPWDMSGSMGIPGRLDDPRMTQATQSILEACAAHGRAAGTLITRPDPEAVRRTIEQGFTFLAISGDVLMLDHVARALVNNARKALRQA